MTFDPTITVSSSYAGSFKHLRTKRGLDTGKTVTLDVSKFTKSTHYPNGFIPGGVVLGQVTSSSKFGPYAAKANEVQHIAVDAAGGTFTISFRGGTTAAIAFNATAAAVQAALELLAEVEVNDIIVTGGPGAAGGATPYILSFQKEYTGQDVAAVTTGVGSLTGGAGTAAVTTTTAGGTTGTDGTQVANCILLDRVLLLSRANVFTAPTIAVAAAMTEGDFVEANMPIASGTAGGIDAAGKSDLGSAFRWS